MTRIDPQKSRPANSIRSPSQLDLMILGSVRWFGLILSLASLSTGCGLLYVWTWMQSRDAFAKWLEVDDERSGGVALVIGFGSGLAAGIIWRSTWWIHILAALLGAYLIWLGMWLTMPAPAPSLPVFGDNLAREMLLYLFAAVVVIVVISSACVIAIAYWEGRANAGRIRPRSD